MQIWSIYDVICEWRCWVVGLWCRSELSRAGRQPWSAVPQPTRCRLYTQNWCDYCWPRHTNGDGPGIRGEAVPRRWLSGLLGVVPAYVITAHVLLALLWLWRDDLRMTCICVYDFCFHLLFCFSFGNMF